MTRPDWQSQVSKVRLERSGWQGRIIKVTSNQKGRIGKIGQRKQRIKKDSTPPTLQHSNTQSLRLNGTSRLKRGPASRALAKKSFS